jgi:hypothetical protein
MNVGLITHGPAYSSRDGINVITYSEPHLNNEYPRGKGPIEEQIRALVEHTFREVIKPGWLHLYPEFDITIREEYSKGRGAYHYAIYSKES